MLVFGVDIPLVEIIFAFGIIIFVLLVSYNKINYVFCSSFCNNEIIS